MSKKKRKHNSNSNSNSNNNSNYIAKSKYGKNNTGASAKSNSETTKTKVTEEVVTANNSTPHASSNQPVAIIQVREVETEVTNNESTGLGFDNSEQGVTEKTDLSENNTDTTGAADNTVSGDSGDRDSNTVLGEGANKDGTAAVGSERDTGSSETANIDAGNSEVFADKATDTERAERNDNTDNGTEKLILHANNKARRNRERNNKVDGETKTALSLSDTLEVPKITPEKFKLSDEEQAKLADIRDTVYKAVLIDYDNAVGTDTDYYDDISDILSNGFTDKFAEARSKLSHYIAQTLDMQYTSKIRAVFSNQDWHYSVAKILLNLYCQTELGLVHTGGDYESLLKSFYMTYRTRIFICDYIVHSAVLYKLFDTMPASRVVLLLNMTTENAIRGLQSVKNIAPKVLTTTELLDEIKNFIHSMSGAKAKVVSEIKKGA